MKLNKVLCLVLSVIMLISVAFFPVFADETRTYIVEAHRDEVYASDEVIVTVRVDGNNIYGCEWTLLYDKNLFEIVEEPNEFWIVMGNEPLKADQVIATYRFKAIAQTTIETGTFKIAEGAVAETREESIVNKHVEPEKEPIDVTILLLSGLDTAITVNGAAAGDSETVTYKDAGYTVKLDPVVNGVSDNEAEMEIYVDGDKKTEREFTFTDPGTYEIKYSTTKKGYIADADKTFKLVIEEDKFDVTPKFDGAEVELIDSAEITFDGTPRKFELEVVPGSEDPEVSVTAALDGTPCDLDDLVFTADGDYAITYTIERKGFTTVDGAFDLTINKATLKVDVTFDGKPVNDGEIKEVTFDAAPHTVLVTSTPEADIKVWVNDVLTPVEELNFTDVKDYVIRYEITKPGYTTENGSFTVKVKNPDYYVEVKNDFTANENGSKTLVLVYTDSDKLSFAYGEDSLTMYEVTSKGYEYVGTEEFTNTENTKVYAIVVDHISSPFEDYYSKVKIVYSQIADEYVIDVEEADKFDLDGSGSIDISDPITAYGVYWGQASYYNDFMKVVLMTDVSNDKDVDSEDTGLFKKAYEDTKK